MDNYVCNNPITGSGWVELCRVGSFRKGSVIQELDSDSLVVLQNDINKRNWKIFSRLIPVYVGHPELDGIKDPPVVGDISQAIYFEERLCVNLRLLDAGIKAITEGFSFLSPYWECRQEGELAYPEHLISVGLVQRPNLPNKSLLANSYCTTEYTLADDAPKKIIEKGTALWYCEQSRRESARKRQ